MFTEKKVLAEICQTLGKKNGIATCINIIRIPKLTQLCWFRKATFFHVTSRCQVKKGRHFVKQKVRLMFTCT